MASPYLRHRPMKEYRSSDGSMPQALLNPTAAVDGGPYIIVLLLYFLYSFSPSHLLSVDDVAVFVATFHQPAAGLATVISRYTRFAAELPRSGIVAARLKRPRVPA